MKKYKVRIAGLGIEAVAIIPFEEEPTLEKLQNNVAYYLNNNLMKIEANEFVLNVIEHGYQLPFSSLPASKHLKNNRSSLNNQEFVCEAIHELIQAGLIVECVQKPFVINPLTVSDNGSKKRLVLDLRHINQHIVIDHVKYEDWKLALQLLRKDFFVYAFDLKSGYHHIDVHRDFHKFLGFSWKFGGGG